MSDRTLLIRTRHDDSALVAAALRPDNTASMETVTTADHVETRIERPSTGGLRATMDDYVCNLQVAAAVGGMRAAASTDEHNSEDINSTNNE